ncbi:MAG: hypothetical protein JAY94_04360 [Candidatus Thiodiazotropha endolucinida]|nr:hypothetical protein [Candidatus Thiodiazotropha taylori]MCW4316724.1 hypothetical protein [Candidatus Thiodiazotropha taylori]
MQTCRIHSMTYLVFGWLFSRLFLSGIRGVDFLEFVVLPGFIIAHSLVWLLISAHQPSSKTNQSVNFYLTFFIFGVIADSLVWWIIRPGTFSELEAVNPWHESVWFGSMISLLLCLSAVFIFSPRLTSVDRSTRPSILLMIMGYLCTVIIYRISYYVTLDLPNEERSIFILGSEIHHAIFGFIGLILLKLWSHSSFPPQLPVLSLLMGICFGFILDQTSYLMLQEVTDEAYGQTISWLGLILGTMLLIGILKINTTNQSFSITSKT